MTLIRTAALAILLVLTYNATGLPQVSGTKPATNPETSSHEDSSRFSVAIMAVKNAVIAGSPIAVQVITRNTSPEPLFFYKEYNPDQAGFAYSVKVNDAKGGVPPDTKLGRTLRCIKDNSPNAGSSMVLSLSGVFFKLDPGASWTNVFHADKLFDLSQPGKYLVQVEQMSQVNRETNRSNLAEVEVLPADTKLTANSSKPGSPLSLTIARLGTEPYVSHAPLVLEVDTTNTSAHPIVLEMEKPSLDQVGTVYKVDIRDQAGTLLPETRYGVNVMNSSSIPRAAQTPNEAGTRLYLLPGESWRDVITVNKVFEVTKPGQYSIRIHRWDSDSRAWINSNSVVTSVAP